MENYELHIDTRPRYNVLNGQFLKGNKPFNKGVPMVKWMDNRKISKVKKCLELGRKMGNKNLAGVNSIPVVGIKDGCLKGFKSASEAARILKSKGVKVNVRNISSVCSRKTFINRCGNPYVRAKAGGYRWFYASDVERYKDLIK